MDIANIPPCEDQLGLTLDNTEKTATFLQLPVVCFLLPLIRKILIYHDKSMHYNL